MRLARVVALLGSAVVLLSAAPTSKSKSVHSKSSKHRRYAKRKTHLAPSYQSHPDPERYQQLQEALADRGYFKGPVNGVWGDDSVDALKRFQTDHKLPDDGKINSLSLIDLGLGPQHGAGNLSAAAATGKIAAPEPPLPPEEQPPPTATKPPAEQSPSDPH